METKYIFARMKRSLGTPLRRSGSANDRKLTELHWLISAISFAGGYKAFFFDYEEVPIDRRSVLVYQDYNFSWLEKMTANEFVRMLGDWKAAWQQEARRQTRVYVWPIESDKVQSASKTCLTELQRIKNHYKSVVGNRNKSKFSSAMDIPTKFMDNLDDLVKQNKYVGVYMTYWDLFDDYFLDLEEKEADTDNAGDLFTRGEQKLILSQGAYRVLKHGIGAGRAFIKGKPFKAVYKGVRCANYAGGLVLGVGLLCREKQSDFRSLSARSGMDKHFKDIKTAVSEKFSPSKAGRTFYEGETFAERFALGPRNLRGYANYSDKKLTDARKAIRHYLMWCECWRKDIKNIEMDLKTELDKILDSAEFIDGDNQVIKENMIEKSNDRNEIVKAIEEVERNSKFSIQGIDEFVAQLTKKLKDADEAKEALDSLHGITKNKRKQVDEFSESYRQKKIAEMNDFNAGIATANSIADQMTMSTNIKRRPGQKESVTYDQKERIAKEAMNFVNNKKLKSASERRNEILRQMPVRKRGITLDEYYDDNI